MLTILNIFGEMLILIVIVAFLKIFKFSKLHLILSFVGMIVLLVSFGIYINIKYPDSNFAFGKVISNNLISYETPSGTKELNFDDDDELVLSFLKFYDIVKLDSNYQNATLIRQEWNKCISGLRTVCVICSYAIIFLAILCIFIFKDLYIVYGGSIAIAVPTIYSLFLFCRPDSDVNKVKYIAFSIICGVISVGIFYLYYKFCENNKEKLKKASSFLDEKLNVFGPYAFNLYLWYAICHYLPIFEYGGVIAGKFLVDLFR